MRYTIGEMAEIIDGDRGKNYPQQHEFLDEGYCLFLNTGNVTKAGFSFDSNQFISKEKCDLLRKGKLQRHDIVYTTRGTVGNAAFYSDSIPYEHVRINSGMVIIRPKETIVCTEFLYQILKSDYYRPFFRKYCTGSAQPQLPIKNFSTIELDLPDLPVQRFIAGILSSYDDLIENNQKQIKLLEEAAQRLYKEWFVDLRFPGHETTPIVDGVPEGWRRERLVDLVDVQYGYAFDGSLFNTAKNGMPIIRIRNIPSGNTDDYTTEEADSRYIVHNGDILVGMDGEFHINSWSGPDAYLVQRTCSFRPNNSEMKGYLLQAIYEPIKYFENTVVGATVAHLGKKHIDTINVLTCPTNLYVPLQDYYEQRQLLLNQNWLSAEARDRLLPKLMNGELEV